MSLRPSCGAAARAFWSAAPPRSSAASPSLAQDIPLPAAGGDDGGAVTTWAWSADGSTPVAQLHGNTLAYAVTDHLGTPRELLAEDGTLAWAATYRVWGALNDNLHPAATAACPLRFPGQIADPESGLHYNRFRYYDPDTGQYLSPDPIGLFGGLRSWGYVHNPNGWIDPLGLAGTNGRSGKQSRLKQIAEDDKASSADRGWIRQEMNSIERGQRSSIRNPPGKELAHERGREAAKGFGYEDSNLQDKDLHKLQHKYDDYGRKNKERPKKCE